jgi:hypothetical protein
VLEPGIRDAVTPIFDLQRERLGVTPQPNASRVACRWMLVSDS